MVNSQRVSKKEINQGIILDREELIRHPKISKNGNIIPLVLSYNGKAPNLLKTMEKH